MYSEVKNVAKIRHIGIRKIKLLKAPSGTPGPLPATQAEGTPLEDEESGLEDEEEELEPMPQQTIAASA